MKTLFTLALISITTFVSAQCINTFPHKEDFEKLLLLQQANVSCDLTVKGDTGNLWKQDPNDGGDWRADTAGTPSIGTGPGATSTTSGEGVGTDYSPGTRNGIYFYTEATGAVCTNAAVNLLSPCYDFSATGKFYRMTFAYHMFGLGIGALHVDVFDKGVWSTVWTRTGDQGQNWNIATVNLANYNTSNILLRIRSVMSSSTLNDIAIDAITVEEYTPPRYDAILMSVRRAPVEYYLYPPPQADSLVLSATVKNEGINSITNVRVVAISGNHKDTLNIGTMAAFATNSGTFPRKFFAKDLSNQTTIQFFTLISEKDSFPRNDSLTINSGLKDTVYSREDGKNTGGIGFNNATTVVQVGQKFHIINPDTLTSVSFLLVNPPIVGDSMKVNLYQFGTSPGNLIASTNAIFSKSGPNWYTVYFPCVQMLDTGNYFVSVAQLNDSNMTLGYTTNFYTPGAAFYNGGATWTSVESANFLITLMIRMNFGKVSYPNIFMTAAKDTICEGESMFIRANGGVSYQWSGGSVQNPTGIFNTVAPTKTTTYNVKGTNACKLSSDASFALEVKARPHGFIRQDTTICPGTPVTLKAGGGSSYHWTNGPSNISWTVSPQSLSSYQVRVDSTNGCSLNMVVNINVDKPKLTTTNDTTICELQEITLSISGAKNYQWQGGPASDNYTVYPASNKIYRVTAFTNLGCALQDSVVVTVLPGPKITSSNDTTICFGNMLTLEAKGGVSYRWENGPSTAKWTFQPLGSGNRFVDVTGSNGCTLRDSVYVGVTSFPNVKLGNDTGICEGTSVTLTASSNQTVNYTWDHGPLGQSVIVSPTSTTTYKVRGTNAGGCFGEDSVKITIEKKPYAAFLVSILGKQVTLVNKSQYANSYLWKFGDGNTSTNASVIHQYANDATYGITLTATNGCGSVDSTVFITIDTKGISDLEAQGIRIYPQPAHNILQINFTRGLSNEIELELYGITGEKIIVERYDGSQRNIQLNLQGLAAGVYQLQLKMDGQPYYYKLIKQ